MSCKKLIDVSSEIKNKFLRVLYGIVKYPLEAFLCFNKLNMMYAFLQRLPVTENFFERAIKAIGISYEIDEQELAKIPQTGS